MSIKSQGGVFGRNPTFNDVTVDGDLSIAGTLSVGGETITGLSYQGGWNASTNTPDIAASSPVTGQFWIVSADGSTDVGGITNWTQGDWALYDGSNWQRVEGGNTDLSTGVQGQLAVANGGTGAADASTALSNLGAATAAQGALADSAIQAADLGTAAYTASTDYATAAQGSLADSAVQPAAIANMLETSDIGSTVQGYDADTAKLDVAQTFTADQKLSDNTKLLVGDGSDIEIYSVGSTAIINHSGVGNLKLQADNFYLQSSDGSETLASGFKNGSMTFYYDNGSRAKTVAGGFQILNGDLIIPSGNGIDFSATSGAGTSELLDDYEEGTWTATLDTSNNDIVATQDRGTGIYTKIGRAVYAHCYIRTDAVTGGTGNVIVTGLPFAATTSSNAADSVGSVKAQSGFNTMPTVCATALGATLINFYKPSGTSGHSALQVADLGTGSNNNWMYITLMYLTD